MTAAVSSEPSRQVRNAKPSELFTDIRTQPTTLGCDVPGIPGRDPEVRFTGKAALAEHPGKNRLSAVPVIQHHARHDKRAKAA
jgi:hypothetical protein